VRRSNQFCVGICVGQIHEFDLLIQHEIDMWLSQEFNGIPEGRIVLDYAGFRTYDSVIRINKIFGQTSFTIISQGFHNRRAIYIAKCFNLNAIGYNAKDVNSASAFKTNLREKFARVKVFVDLLINKEPKFLGEKIEIGN